MAHRLVNLLTALTLLACVAVCVLWVRSSRHEDAFSRVVLGDRYTLSSRSGVIGLFGPPPLAADARVWRGATELIRAMHNDHVCWRGWWREEQGHPFLSVHDVPDLILDTPGDRAATQFSPGDLARPLLAALEDPERLAVAHVLLVRHFSPAGKPQVSSRPIPGLVLGDCPIDYGSGEHRLAPWTEVRLDGLNVTLDRWMGREHCQIWWGVTSLGEWTHGLCGKPEVSGLPAVREEWHRRLDVPIAIAPPTGRGPPRRRRCPSSTSGGGRAKGCCPAAAGRTASAPVAATTRASRRAGARSAESGRWHRARFSTLCAASRSRC